MYDRRNYLLRQQYAELKYCKEVCNGLDEKCPKYALPKNKSVCVWYDIIERDVEKIKLGLNPKTFPILEVILQE
jgi:hypothetical protein